LIHDLPGKEERIVVVKKYAQNTHKTTRQFIKYHKIMLDKNLGMIYISIKGHGPVKNHIHTKSAA